MMEDDTDPDERVRHDDPDTSHHGAQRSYRKGSQKARLILAYAVADHDYPGVGLAPEQAAQMCGLFEPGICYWKRVGELRDAGLVDAITAARSAPIAAARTASSSSIGSLRPVCSWRWA